MLGSSRNWLSAGADLAEWFHVFALDFRNHGRSPHADEMSYAELAADVVAWMDRQGLPAATIAGHSLGGKTAMLLACRHPSRVRQLAVIDIAPRDYYWPAHRASFAAMNELDLRDLRSRAEAELRFEARVPGWGMRKFLATNLEQGEDGRWYWQVNLPVLTRALPELERNPVAPGAAFAGETLFIAGGRSEYVTPADHVTIRRHFPQARIEVLAESGHNPHLEARPALVDLLRTLAHPEGAV
jgi:pimeloyl-ACP methyl ester carboxylesterase